MTVENAVARMNDRGIVKNRADAADDFAEVLLGHWDQMDEVDVAPLTAAILSRWSLSGLAWIKREGWRLAQSVEHLQARHRDVE